MALTEDDTDTSRPTPKLSDLEDLYYVFHVREAVHDAIGIYARNTKHAAEQYLMRKYPNGEYPPSVFVWSEKKEYLGQHKVLE